MVVSWHLLLVMWSGWQWYYLRSLIMKWQMCAEDQYVKGHCLPLAVFVFHFCIRFSLFTCVFYYSQWIVVFVLYYYHYYFFFFFFTNRDQVFWYHMTHIYVSQWWSVKRPIMAYNQLLTYIYNKIKEYFVESNMNVIFVERCSCKPKLLVTFF